jgi:hypothetical protein
MVVDNWPNTCRSSLGRTLTADFDDAALIASAAVYFTLTLPFHEFASTLYARAIPVWWYFRAGITHFVRDRKSEVLNPTSMIPTFHARNAYRPVEIAIIRLKSDPSADNPTADLDDFLALPLVVVNTTLWSPWRIFTSSSLYSR